MMAIDVTILQEQGRVPVTVLQPHGDLDASNYRDLIAEAKNLCSAGVEDMLLDLGDVPYLSSSGLVALHSVAALLRGEEPPDPETGWGAFRAIDRDRAKGLQPHLKLLNPQPHVDRVLETVGFKQFFEVYTDREAAVASF
jgi:anti-anti-sigma regulatory factor